MEKYLGFFIVILLLFGIFYIGRLLMLWYWRVAIAIKNQEETNRLLHVIVDCLKEIEQDLTKIHQTDQSKQSEE